MNLIKTAGITEFKKGIKKMQSDFHYYCIFVLAYYAGFEKEEARKIAYSSQYVDDATESKPINFEQFSFDPIRTAYYSLKAYDWGIQKKIYIPFHFLPARAPLRSTNEFTYVTEPNSQFAKLLLLEAVKEKTENWLHRLGIALHTYADTWAHNGFSGRQNNENRVEDINLYEREKWKKPLWENILLDAFPTIGHCEANRYPDYSFLKWKYKNHKNQSIERDNTQIFLTAAETILKELCNITRKRVNWQEIEETIKQLFLCDIDENKKCNAWAEQFPKIFETQENIYDKIAWRKEALGAETDKNYQWDEIPPEKFETLEFRKKEDFFNSNWVKFQRAALLQRNLVLYSLT